MPKGRNKYPNIFPQKNETCTFAVFTLNFHPILYFEMVSDLQVGKGCLPEENKAFSGNQTKTKQKPVLL